MTSVWKPSGACLLMFTNLDDAIRVGEVASVMITSRSKLSETIAVAREHGFEF